MNYQVMYKGQDDASDSLQHWKYKYKKRVNGKWRYYYDDSRARKNGSNPGKAPTSYKPESFGKWEQTSFGSRKGYVDSNGIFYEGDYDTARQTKWEREFKAIGVKTEVERAKSQYNGSVRKKIDDVIDSVTELRDLGKETINKGRNAAADILDKLSKKIRT